jgi:signal transduction histidine kinase
MNDQLTYALLDQQPVSIVFYKPLYENSKHPDRITDFEFAYNNKTAADLLGISRIELNGRTLSSIEKTNNGSKDLLFKQLLSVYTTGEVIENEYFNEALGKYFHVTRKKLPDGVLTIAKDVTNEVILREESKKQVLFADQVLNTSLNAWFYCDTIRNENGDVKDFIFRRINPGFTRITRLNENTVVGKSYLSLFPTSLKNGIFDLNLRVANKKTSERQQLYYDGDNLNAWYDVVVSPFGEDGILVTFADITLEKEKELEAARLADTLQTVFNTVQVGIFIFKPEYNNKGEIKDFRFVMANPGLSAYVAQEPETLIGDLGSEWFPGYLTNGVFDMYLDTYNTGNTNRKQFQYHVDGIDAFLDLQSAKMGNEVLVTFSDYTPLQLAQLELQKSIHELERSNQNLEEFARAASHDLKEPVRKIKMFSDILKRTIGVNMNDEVKGLFNKMENAASRMNLLIDDLLEYSHVNSPIIQFERVDLNDIIQLVTSDLEVMINETETIVEYEALPTIQGNRRQLQQLFLNLIHNAIKYRKPGVDPHIFMHSRKVSGEASGIPVATIDENKLFYLIEVSDNGIGFDQENAEKIFHVFTRLHSNREYAGTGIGLSIVNKVMENHKGYVSANGIRQQGATFSLLFPVTMH